MSVIFRKLIYISIIAASIGCNIYLFVSDDDSYIEEYEAKIDKLEEKIDSINIKNLGLNKEIVLLESKVDILDDQVSDIEEKRKSIIKSYEIYLQRITDIDDSELEQWFLSRYNDNTTE